MPSQDIVRDIRTLVQTKLTPSVPPDERELFKKNAIIFLGAEGTFRETSK